MNLAMYILVNSDIKIGKGKLAGQVGHAVAVYFYRGNYTKEFIDDYMKIQKKIILQCPQNKLEELEQEGYITIRDKGLTQLEPDTLTCVNMGIFDRDKDEVPEFVRELKLYSK
jgi:PTH2 family peptidyl-tRNA hydrolase